MRTLIPIVALLLAASAAHAGQQANPLPVYAADDTPHFLLFTRGGIIFEGHLYEPAGGGVHRVVLDPGTCADDERGRREGTLAFEGPLIRWTWIERAGCGEDRPVWRRIERTFSRAPAPDEGRCKPTARVYRQGSQRLTVEDRCDGTLKLGVAGVDGWVVVSKTAPGRYEGRDRFTTETPVSWEASLRWSPTAQSTTPDITLQIGDETRTLSGRFVLQLKT